MRRTDSLADEKPPPYSLNLERSILSAVLNEPDRFDDVRPHVGAEDFYLDPHQQVFRAIEEMVEAGRTVEMTSLTDHLYQTGRLANVGGRDFLVAIERYSPVVGPLPGYSRRVREFATHRALIHALRASLRDAEAHIGSIQDLVAATEQRLFDLQREDGVPKPIAVATLIREGLASIDARQNDDGAPPGIETGVSGP
jgi:replicative DNA helicase